MIGARQAWDEHVRRRLRGMRAVIGGRAQTLLELGYVVVVLGAVDVSVNGQLDIVTVFGATAPSLDGGLLVEIPPDIYLYALLGAGVYVTTSLVFEPKESVAEVRRLGYRLLAALPLAAGVFLFASVILGGDAIAIPIDGEPGDVSVDAHVSAAGLAFLAGLFIRLTLKKLGDIAEAISKVGQLGELSYRAQGKRLEATEAVVAAWRRAGDADGPARALSAEGYESLREAETLLGSEDATLTQLDRATELAEDARAAFEAASSP